MILDKLFQVWEVYFFQFKTATVMAIIRAFFISNAFFQLSLSFQLQLSHMLLRCCLIHITIIILRHILYLVYLCPYLVLGLSMWHLCDLFLIFNLISIVINHINPLKQTHLAFVRFLKYFQLFLDDSIRKRIIFK